MIMEDTMPAVSSLQKSIYLKEELKQRAMQRFIEDYHFSVAVNKEQTQKAFRLRHEVFLKEFNYEMQEDAERSLEIDEYDKHSIHCLIEHKRTNRVAGCLRIIMPSLNTSNHPILLPVEKKGGQFITHPSLMPSQLPANKTCEASRLAISRTFRKRTTANNPSDTSFDETVSFTQEEIQTFSLISLGLCLCAYSVVNVTNQRHVFAMMEPSLPRLIALFGFHFTKVSGPIIYHGKRYAYYIDQQTVNNEMSGYMKQLYEHIHSKLAPEIRQLLDQSNAMPAL